MLHPLHSMMLSRMYDYLNFMIRIIKETGDVIFLMGMIVTIGNGW